jgi:hypothetical protein
MGFALDVRNQRQQLDCCMRKLSFSSFRLHGFESAIPARVQDHAKRSRGVGTVTPSNYSNTINMHRIRYSFAYGEAPEVGMRMLSKAMNTASKEQRSRLESSATQFIKQRCAQHEDACKSALETNQEISH